MDDDGDVVVDVEEELPDVAGALVVACVPPPAWDELFVEWISQPTAPASNTTNTITVISTVRRPRSIRDAGFGAGVDTGTAAVGSGRCG
ncbi:MAG TPA: hypothetical protein VF444_04295, partial [Pseudonocardiaceae bacterium]